MSRSELLAGERHFVLTLTIASRTLRFSHQDLDISQDDGADRPECRSIR